MTDKPDYHWTDPDLTTALKGCDAIELAGCIDDGQSTRRVGEQFSGERIDDLERAQFFSLYGHRQGEGADCFADRATYAEAKALGDELAAKHGIPLHDFS